MEVGAIEANLESIFEETGAILKGHFLLTSGLHSPVYWEKFRVLHFPQYTQQLCRLISQHFAGYDIDMVAGPTTGGIILAHEVGRQMKLPALFAENAGGDKRCFRRGLGITPGQKVLIVDDILTTGKSIRQVLELVQEQGGCVAGIGVLVDRSEQQHDFGAHLFSCLRSVTPAYQPDECPLCARGIPLTRPGGSQPVTQ
jgi:orotate phosphoribosyltransferase